MSKRIAVWGFLVCLVSMNAMAQEKPSRESWGAPPVSVTESGGTWTIAGRKQTVTVDGKDLSMQVRAGAGQWNMVPSGPNDMILKGVIKPRAYRLADARAIKIEPYDTGFKTGVQITLSDFLLGESGEGGQLHLGLTLYLTVALEGKDEELAFSVAAKEGEPAQIDRLDWPTAMDARDVDFTVLSHIRGVLLPRNYDKVYNPIRAQNADGSYRHPKETTEPQSNIIEDWSMSWWGFQKGRSAMMIIIETPDDAAYQFEHPAGGPTIIGPRWRESLGRLGYMRSGRMIFFEQGNYVTLAKRYRKYAKDTGLFVSLAEKIQNRPIVKELIGTPFSRIGILTNIKSDSLRYSTTQPERNFRLTTFDERADQLRQLKQNGLDRFMVVLTGWPKEGYDREHPDVLPPAPRAGGWEGMKRLADTCKGLGYLFTLHDQYRDYYTDAPSYNRQFALHEEDENPVSRQFPGSRFGQWKKGKVAYMNNWDGGEMNYLNPRFMLGHNVKNYQAMFDHGVRIVGSYQDVFGYVPPDQDFNPQHPTTRTDGRIARELVMKWCRNNIGIVGTEAGCDWTVPLSDWCTPPGQNRGIVVPLFNLVYHDAVMSPAGADDLRGLLNGCFPQIGGGQITAAPSENLKRMMALHKRVALLEMTNHEFLDERMRKERTTFSDGTTVTVDWDARSVEIKPELKLEMSAPP
jgi:hypothetical protein